MRNITYDAVGNIQSLDRRGTLGCGDGFKKGLIDRLSYNYQPLNPIQWAQSEGEPQDINRLNRVIDGASVEGLKEQGFDQNGAFLLATYTYDAAGRLSCS